MEKIVCLVDLEGTSDSALEYAAGIAQKSGRELVLLNAVPVPVFRELVAETLGKDSPVVALEKESRQRLEPFRKFISDKYGIACRVLVQSDYLLLDKGIAEEIEAGKYKLAVMGTSSAESLWPSLNSVNSDHLLKRITAPLLIVPQGMEFRQSVDIVYATDYESQDAYAVKILPQLFSGFNPGITVMHVSYEDTEVSRMLNRSMRNELEDQSEGVVLKFDRMIDREIVSGIHRFMKKKNGAMLAMLLKDHSLTGKIFGREIIEQINRISSYPLLVIHAPENDLSVNHKGIVL